MNSIEELEALTPSGPKKRKTPPTLSELLNGLRAQGRREIMIARSWDEGFSIGYENGHAAACDVLIPVIEELFLQREGWANNRSDQEEVDTLLVLLFLRI